MNSRCLLVILFLSDLALSNLGISESLPCPVPPELSPRLHEDPAATDSVSTDFGNVVHDKPLGVLYPTSLEDIITLVKTSFNCFAPFGIGTRGNGHSTHGQDMAFNGVVIDMKALRDEERGSRIVISKDEAYADIGGEQLWLDVLSGALSQGYSPFSWTDYLNLTVGGTLSNAGISGQTFRFGPQISNVQELDVITGKGELVTCSPTVNSELFYGALGGLGQFGIITRARIPLGPAPTRVRWALILYSNFTAFTIDQENYIAINGRTASNAVSYLEGGILLDNGTPNTWRTFFFPPEDVPKITALTKQYGIIYSIEVATNYVGQSKNAVDRKMKQFFKQLSSVPEYTYEKDVSYTEFLTRVPPTEPNGQAHPWLNFFIPKSGITAFNSGVFRDILLKRNITTGPVLFYPMNKNKWDDRMSAVIADEDIVYTLGLLVETGIDNLKAYEDQNQAILDFFDKAGINAKQYLGNQASQAGWIKHFGPKWNTFQQRKALFDPKNILSPGQKIFN